MVSQKESRHNRELEVARKLFDNKAGSFDLTQVEKLIEDRFAFGGSSRNITAGALRNLQRMGYIVASNIFSFGNIQSQVKGVFDENGRNTLIDFVKAIKGETEIPALNIDWKDAINAIEIYRSHYIKRKDAEEREKQIVEYLAKIGRATSQEVGSNLRLSKHSVFGYLQDLKETGRVVSESVKKIHYYSLVK
jgi:DNA-binding CsgD family transcriptional regulator